MNDDQRFMARAIELAKQGEGQVEPNPMVGCVVVRDGEIVGEGWHQQFGGAHAEVNALAAADKQAQGASLYVTLEPCCHTGKTGPCSQAVIAAGVSRVVVAVRDPFPSVNGGGIAELEAAGIACQVGVLQEEATELLAPYLKLVTKKQPWVIAKWAMTLDGKIAARDGSSRWISSPESRTIVQQIRGRVDAILVGRKTAIVDDPLLTARPAGPRLATRIVLGEPPRGSQLVKTIADAPLLVVVRDNAAAEEASWLTHAGAEVLVIEAASNAERFTSLLDELGNRQMTNILVEGGGGVLGAALDAGQIDEVHAFIAPKLIGGQPSPSPIAGQGRQPMAEALALANCQTALVGGDMYVNGRINHPKAT